MPATPDPEMKTVLDQLAKLDPKPIETLSPAEARKQPTPADAVKRIALKSGAPGPRPEAVGENDDYKIPGAADDIKVRVSPRRAKVPFL